MESKEMNLH